MVKMVKNCKKAGRFVYKLYQRHGLYQSEFFSPTSGAGRFFWGGGEGTTVVGLKPPTSPSFGSGSHATPIRVK